MAPFRHRLRVRYHECDPQGVVFNANYLAYADIAITELFREAFGSWEAPMAEHGVDMVVAEANVRYLAPVGFDEEIDLVATIERLGETSATTRIEMGRDGEIAAEVTIRHVVVDAQTRAKAPIPPAIRTPLARFT